MNINKQWSKSDKCSNQDDTMTLRQKCTLTKTDFQLTRHYPHKLVGHYYDEKNVTKDKVSQQFKSRYKCENLLATIDVPRIVTNIAIIIHTCLITSARTE